MLRISENQELFEAVAEIISKNEKQYDEYMVAGEIGDEELKKVKKLDIKCKSLKGIEKLISLTKISVIYCPQNNEENYDEPIDLQHNTKLRNISISILRTDKTINISGIENLECLNEGKGKLFFQLNGTATLENMEDIIAKSNKKNIKKMVLPLISLAKEKSINPDILQMLSESKANIRFRSYNANDEMRIQEAIEIDKKITKIKKELELSKRDEKGKIIKTFEYISKNFEFAEEEFAREPKGFASGLKDSIRGTNSVLDSKKGVCVAFSNIFNYILQSEGIESVPIHGQMIYEGVGHQLSLVRSINGKVIIADPTQGTGAEEDYMFYCSMPNGVLRGYCKLDNQIDDKDIKIYSKKEIEDALKSPFVCGIQEDTSNHPAIEVPKKEETKWRTTDNRGER